MTTDLDVVVLGSGMAAWGAHHRLSESDATHRYFDKGTIPGGHTKTFRDPSGFIFDEGPHISFTEDEGVRKILEEAVGGHFETIDTYVDNWYKGSWVKHPAQCNLHGLPPELVTDCLIDLVTASFTPAPDEVANYAEWLVAAYGKTFAENFPMVYGHKYHTLPADQMSTDWLGPRLYQPDLREVIAGATNPATPNVHYISHFRYPTKGGFSSYLDPFHAAADVTMDHEVTAIDPAARQVSFANGVTTTYDRLISSIPLPILVPMISGVPAEVVEASKRLACTKCVVVNVGVNRADISPAQWRYFYDPEIIFARLSFPHMLSPETVPAGHGAIQVECYFSDKYKPLDRPAEQVADEAVDDLVKCGLISHDEVVFRDIRIAEYANVIFDLERAEAVETVHGFLEEVGIERCGRYGDWDYSWTDQAFRSGQRAAGNVLD